MRIDHLVLAVPDLEAAGAQIEADTGLPSVAGGRHPGWGTENRIVPLGAAYVELVSVADHAEAEGAGFGRLVLAAIDGGAGLIGWAAQVDDLDAVAARLGLDITPGARDLPDGSRLTWRLAGVEQAAMSSALPFFIQWDGPAGRHPGAAADRAATAEIAWIKVAGDGARLRDWLGPEGAALPLRTTEGSRDVLVAAGLQTPAGEYVLR